jgi:signal transduction histidine kinase
LNTKRFSESTCDTLLSSVLRGCSTSQLEQLPELEHFGLLESAFVSWIKGKPAETSLSDWLVQDSSWRSDNPASERLWQAANVAVRLHALEQRFSGELESQKRKAIYHLAYGLSHELNNPLANIATRAGVLAHRETVVESRQLLETIIDNAMRGSEMLGDLMLLARPPKLNFDSTHLTQWFESFIARCTSWASKRNLKILSKCEVQSQMAKFDQVAVTEAAWCLVRNAFEAAGECDPVQIHFEEVAGVLQLSVCDSGPGLSAEALRNCFDPFYSGREAGRGLGLGLSKAQLIATLHRGSVTLSNRPAGGCLAVLTWRASS